MINRKDMSPKLYETVGGATGLFFIFIIQTCKGPNKYIELEGSITGQ